MYTDNYKNQKKNSHIHTHTHTLSDQQQQKVQYIIRIIIAALKTATSAAYTLLLRHSEPATTVFFFVVGWINHCAPSRDSAVRAENHCHIAISRSTYAKRLFFCMLYFIWARRKDIEHAVRCGPRARTHVFGCSCSSSSIFDTKCIYYTFENYLGIATLRH